jgi:hypothetical protein
VAEYWMGSQEADKSPLVAFEAKHSSQYTLMQDHNRMSNNYS